MAEQQMASGLMGNPGDPSQPGADGAPGPSGQGGGGAPGGEGGRGRPQSFQKPPKLESKDGGTRSTITTS